MPKNAKDGLWINPYIFNSDKSFEVDEVMFICSNRNILTKEISLDWELIEFENHPTRINKFFDIDRTLADSTVLNSVNDYEQTIVDNWNELSNDQYAEKAFDGIKSHIVNPNSFSSTFSIPLDSISSQNVKITADCWVNSPNYKLSNDISLIISIDDKQGNIVRKGLPIDGQLIDEKHWNNIFNFIEYQHKAADCTLSIYVWNTSNAEVLIDDFRVMILSQN